VTNACKPRKILQEGDRALRIPKISSEPERLAQRPLPQDQSELSALRAQIQELQQKNQALELNLRDKSERIQQLEREAELKNGQILEMQTHFQERERSLKKSCEEHKQELESLRRVLWIQEHFRTRQTPVTCSEFQNVEPLGGGCFGLVMRCSIFKFLVNWRDLNVKSK
jgi:chromosome segregation ATPase